MSDTFLTKRFAVEIDYDPHTGAILAERWRNRFGELERRGDLPAFIVYCPETGVPTYQRWHNGKGQHREGDKPSLVATDPGTGTTLSEQYTVLGHTQREGDRPAYIRRTSEGQLLEERYFRNGRLHRDPSYGPAVVSYDQSTGRPTTIEFWIDGARLGPPKEGPSLDFS